MACKAPPGTTNASTTKAILYAAKSTEDEHGSIETQLADCRKLAEREGWEVVGEYEDEAASAWSGDRGPDLAAAMDHAEREALAVLIVQHSDRLARGDGAQAQHLVEIVTRAKRGGVTIRSVQDDFFGDPRMDVLMGALMGMRNTEDSARKSAATKAGKRRAWEHGEFGGGPIPDGFEAIRDGDRRTLLPDPDRIEVIRLIANLADQGWGDPSIGRELNRRGLRTKGGGPWTRRRIQDLLTNPVYYGGIAWRRGKEDEEVNWGTSFTAPWTREDYQRRSRERGGRDVAKGSNRKPGRPQSNHALAGLARCGKCGHVMRPITSSYRRKDGSRKRTYVCRHVHESTGLCDMPPIDAEAVDAHVANGLGRYLGDFEGWREQLLVGYATERQRLEREVERAREDVAEQERVRERIDHAIGLAEDEGQTRAAMRAASKAQEELERHETRLAAAQQGLEDVPTEAPADRMLDFYNELGAAVRGRLEGTNTLARVNEALRDTFMAFVIEASWSPSDHMRENLASAGLEPEEGSM